MAKKTRQQYNSSSSSEYELKCEAARKARQIKKWSKFALFALAITLLSPFISASPVQIAQAAALIPTPNTWTNYSGSTTGPSSPTPVSRAMEVWDPDHNQLIIHGGFLQTSPNAISDTWKLDPSTGAWALSVLPSNTPTTTVPPTRAAGCGVWDTSNHQMLIFGGDELAPVGLNSPMNKVWAFDPTGNAGAGAWKQYNVANPGTDPEPSDGRVGVGCGWDPSVNKMLIFGGGPGDDVWAFDPGTGAQNTTGTWTEVLQQSVPFACGRANGATPGSRSYVSSVWNPNQNTMLIWGGEDTCQTASLNTLNNVWSFNPGGYGTHSGSWTKLNSLNGGIGAREGAAAVWDPTINQMVIFGGQGSSSFFNDVWNYSPTKGQWSKRTPNGTAPSTRGYVAAAFITSTTNLTQTMYFGGDLGGTVVPNNDYLWGLGVAPQLGLKFSNTIPGFTAGGAVTSGTQVQLTAIDGTTVIPNTTGVPITVTIRVSAASNNANCGFVTSNISMPPTALACGSAPGIYTPTVELHIQPNNSTSDEYFFYSDTLAGNRTVVGEATTDTSISAIQVVTVSPGNPTSLAFTRQPSATAIQNVAFAQQPIVALTDTFSNTVTTAAATPITLTLRAQGDVAPPAGATISGTTTLTTVSGVITYSGLAITKGSTTPYQLKASAVYSGTALPDTLSTNITINCIAGTSLVTILTDPTLPVADNCQVSLRQAILNANAAASGSAAQTVTFGVNLLTTPVTSTLQTIAITGQALPTLSAGVKINAGCDVITPTVQVGQRGRPRIAIDGSGITSLGAGQTITSALTLSNGITNTGNLVNGLAIVNVPGYGIVINNSSDNTITCNYIGTDDGISAKPNLSGGIYITNTNAITLTGRANNIGLSGSPTSGNLISGNGANGNGAAQVEAKGVGAKVFLYHNFLGNNASRAARLTSAPNTGGPVLKISGRARVVLKQGNWLRR